ncbi:unnamed protein product [Adineta ricciae]|uniref:trimethyllysine dioxygenase n=1 Tax=Adineta ricciae TaxID=249248 RepID=A0A814Q9X7_ADIRI|nr:unnamed protein product [Adineta ricciae]CAF1116634.1 unnamed protein product [Adineta ricciae]
MRSVRPLFRFVQCSIPSHGQQRFLRVEKCKDHLRLIDKNDTMDFHYIWLRHNCPDVGKSIHPKTGERIVDCAEIPSTIEPEHVELTDAERKLKVVWSKDHSSFFDIAFLLANAYGKNRLEAPKPQAKVEDIELIYDKTQHETYLKNCYDRLKKFGLVVVRQRGLDTEAIIKDFLPCGASVVETHFGRIEDLRTDNTTNKNNDQLGYTDAAINLHTDQPFIADPPGMQLLQCIRRADTGGSNTLVNAAHSALYLREIDPSAYYLLTNVPVRFHRKQKQFQSVHVGPLIETNGDEIKQIRHSYFTLAPFQFPYWLTVAYYNAYRKFASILYDPQCQYRVQLESGDFVLYDNFKMLHARDSFTGPRHLRGIYFRHTDVWKKLEKFCQRNQGTCQKSQN